MKILILLALVALDLTKAIPFGNPPPTGFPPFPLPPSFPDFMSAKNCSQNTDCAVGLNCCRLPCGLKCIPLIPDPTLKSNSPGLCPEELLKKLNISVELPGFSGSHEGFPNLSSKRNCSEAEDCDRSSKCCQTPFGAKCIPPISYNSSSEGNVVLCPLEFIQKVFHAMMNMSGHPPPGGPGGQPPIGPPPDSRPVPPPCPMGNTGADQLNNLINGIAAELKRIIPEKKNNVEIINVKIQGKVKEATLRIQEKIASGLNALRTVLELLKNNKIPPQKVRDILVNAEKACPGGMNAPQWDLYQKIDTVMNGLKTFQSSVP